MNKKLLYLILGLISTTVCSSTVFGYGYLPDFTKMQNFRCDFEETIYNQDNSVVTQNNRFKIFKLDIPNKKIFINKEPIDHILYFENDKIEFKAQSMTDEFIELSHTVIDMNTLQYTSESNITYDNSIYGVKHTKSKGSCKFLN